MRITINGIDNASAERLKKKLLELSKLDISDAQKKQRAKKIIKEYNNLVKSTTFETFERQNEKWVKVDTSGDDLEAEIIVPASASERDIPYVALTQLEKTIYSNKIQFDKIAGNLYKDVSFVFDNWFIDGDYGFKDLEDDMSIALGSHRNYAKTITNTFFSSVDRVRNVADGEVAGYNWFHFKHTVPERPFCQLFDDIILHKDDWEKLDDIIIDLPITNEIRYKGKGNGQDLPILSSGGGFNCRGDMRPVSKETYEKHLEKHKDRYKKIFEILKPKNDDTVKTSKEIDALKERVKKDGNSNPKRREIISDFYDVVLSDGEVKIYNESLQKEIFVNNRVSKGETKTHACKSVESTLAVFDLHNVLKNAKKVSETKIVNGKNRKKGVEAIIVLEDNIEYVGNVKLTVAVYKNGKMVQYCLTAERKK